MSKTRIAVVGLGHAANDFHLPCLSKFGDVELILCEAWTERLKEGCQRWNIPNKNVYSDLDAMLKEADPDAVYVLLPQYSSTYRETPSPYVEYVLKVLDAKKPVFVEKPIGENAEQARPLIDSAKRNGVKTTMCGFQRRFNPLLRYGIRMVRDRGPILNCGFSFLKGTAKGCPEEKHFITPNWLTLDMIHCLDLMRSVPDGYITDFMSTVGTVPGEEIATAFHALARFSSGTTSFFTSNVRVGARVLCFELHGIGISVFIRSVPEDGRLTANDGCSANSMEAMIYTNNNPDSPEIVHSCDVALNNSQQAAAGFWDQSRHFVDCVKRGVETDTPFEDALATVELCDRILTGETE